MWPQGIGLSQETGCNHDVALSMEVIYNLPGEVSVENGGMVYNQRNSHDFWLSGFIECYLNPDGK